MLQVIVLLVPGFVPTENHTNPSPDTASLASLRVEYQELVGGFGVPGVGVFGALLDSWKTVKFDAPSFPSSPSSPGAPVLPSCCTASCQVVINVLLLGLNAALPKELHIGLLPEGTSAISSSQPAGIV